MSEENQGWKARIINTNWVKLYNYWKNRSVNNQNPDQEREMPKIQLVAIAIGSSQKLIVTTIEVNHFEEETSPKFPNSVPWKI